MDAFLGICFGIFCPIIVVLFLLGVALLGLTFAVCLTYGLFIIASTFWENVLQRPTMLKHRGLQTAYGGKQAQVE